MGRGGVGAGSDRWGGDFAGLEIGREEEVGAEQYLLEKEQCEVLQATERKEQWEQEGEEEILEGEGVVEKHVILEGEDITHMVMIVEEEAKAEADVKQPEEKPVAQEQAESRTSGNSTWSSVESLKAPHMIQFIHGFWVKTLSSHPQISAIISEQDEDLLSYLANLEVKELGHSKYTCELMFFFRSNPYFLNEVIIKKYHLSLAGFRSSRSSEVHWFWDYERGLPSRRHDTTSINFLNWLSEHNLPGSSRIAEIITEDLWPNPLQHYPRDTGPREGTMQEYMLVSSPRTGS
ncbi:testis-specific Y-encoded protein 1-like [Saccopteryx bilineata]|uniref:testis-specific Y-encoded protein 1-like n=1 Tax=Saccopteryx bilineata TaxID=59482 RepID=UPI00338F139A